MLTINLLWFVYKGWLLPARTCEYNLSLQHPYCLLCFPSPSQQEIMLLLSYEQLFDAVLVFQNDTNIEVFSKLCKSFGFVLRIVRHLMLQFAPNNILDGMLLMERNETKRDVHKLISLFLMNRDWKFAIQIKGVAFVYEKVHIIKSSSPIIFVNLKSFS